MARQGNTTQVGLGYREHQKPRQHAISAMPDGTSCPLCGQPMHKDKTRNWDGQPLHYDHVIARAYGDAGRRGPRRLTHATCNIRAGQAVRAQLRPRRPATRRHTAYTRW